MLANLAIRDIVLIDRLDLEFSVARIRVVEQHLAREVGLLDDVAIDEDQVTDSAARQRLRDHAAERAAADQQHARIANTCLARLSERCELNLADKPLVVRLIGLCHAQRLQSVTTSHTKPARSAKASSSHGSTARKSPSTG